MQIHINDVIHFLLLICMDSKWLNAFFRQPFTCETQEVDTVQVPTDVKKAYDKLFSKNHSDRGKEKQQFEDFKKWFNHLLKAHKEAVEFLEIMEMSYYYTKISNNASNLTTSDDNGYMVPKDVKDSWKKWCLKYHPDRGGDTTEIFQTTKGKYDSFKDWFKYVLDIPSKTAMLECMFLGHLQSKTDASLEKAENALKEGEYQKAIELSKLAEEENEKYVQAKEGSSSPSYRKQQEKFKTAIETIKKKARDGLAKGSCSSVNITDMRAKDAQIEALQTQNGLLQAENEILKTDVISTMNKNNNLENTIKTLRQEVSSLNNCKASETQMQKTLEEELKHQNRELQMRLDESESAKLKAMQDNQALQARVESLEEKRNELDKKISAARTCLS